MATKQFLGTRYQSFKDDGTVNAGGSVYFYETGTSTAKTTYSDSALSVASANANPVVLDSAGAADIWYSGDADVTVKDSTGTTIDSYTSINPTTSTTITESNFIANGSFEEGGSTTPTGWTRSAPPSGGTSAQDADSAHGLYSWKFTSAGSGAGSLISDAFFNVAEGRTFNVIWQMKSSVADVRNLVEVVWYDDADAELSASSLYDDSATNPTSWTTTSALATPVSSAVRAKIRLTGCHSSDATAGSTWFDGVQVTEAAVLGIANTFSDVVTVGSSVTSTKAAVSGYSRVTPNMCRLTTVAASTSLVYNTITAVTGPTGSKGLILEIENIAASANSIATRWASTTVYSDSGATTTIALTRADAYEHVAIGTGTTLAYSQVEVHVKCDTAYKVWLKFLYDAGTYSSAAYRIVGYYD